jgi:hypothetical protein
LFLLSLMKSFFITIFWCFFILAVTGAATFSNINSGMDIWDYHGSLPGPFVKYPFVQYYQLFTATGGCYIGFPGILFLLLSHFFSIKKLAIIRVLNFKFHFAL